MPKRTFLARATYPLFKARNTANLVFCQGAFSNDCCRLPIRYVPTLDSWFATISSVSSFGSSLKYNRIRNFRSIHPFSSSFDETA